MGDYVTPAQFAAELGVTVEAVDAWLDSLDEATLASGLIEFDVDANVTGIHISLLLPDKRPSL